jgi:hypothetical protein
LQRTATRFVERTAADTNDLTEQEALEGDWFLMVRRRPAAAGLMVTALAVTMSYSGSAFAVSGGSPATDVGSGFVAKVDIGGVRSCTGALIAPQWVATAKSCFAFDGKPVLAGPPTKESTATIGRPDLTKSTGHVVSIVDLVPRGDRNLVLARLSAPVTDVSPARLATAAPGVGETLRVAGFGRTATEWIPDQLHVGDFAVQSVAATTVAILGTATSVCKGDSGGPAFRNVSGNAELVAVNSASWQGGCLGEAETAATPPRPGPTTSRTGSGRTPRAPPPRRSGAGG